jgi:hypothetical protein
MPEIGRATRSFVSAYDRARIQASRLYRFEKRALIANFNGAIPIGTTIASATWRTDAPDIGVMSAPAISTNLRETSVLYATQLGGFANIRCEATLNDGSIYNQNFRINVRETSCFFDDPPNVSGPASVTVVAP